MPYTKCEKCRKWVHWVKGGFFREKKPKLCSGCKINNVLKEGG
jgi:hypothetical protein